MLDLNLNSDFDVTLDDTNDLATTDSRAQFHQSVAVYLQDYLYNVSKRGISDETAKERVRLEVTRIARDHGRLDSIERISVEDDPDQPDRLLVEIDYIGTDSYIQQVTA